jgi:hypothetical protein
MDKASKDIFKAYNLIQEQLHTTNPNNPNHKTFSISGNDKGSLLDKKFGSSFNSVKDSPYHRHSSDNINKQEQFAKRPVPTVHVDAANKYIPKYQALYDKKMAALKAEYGESPQGVTSEKIRRLTKLFINKYTEDIAGLEAYAMTLDKQAYERMSSPEWNSEQGVNSGNKVNELVAHIAGTYNKLFEIEAAYHTGDEEKLKLIYGHGGVPGEWASEIWPDGEDNVWN